MTSYPVERYIELENNPYLLGRIIVHEVRENFHSEIDIIHKESHKIFKHIETLYQQPSGEEALISGVQRLRQYLDDVAKISSDSNYH